MGIIAVIVVVDHLASGSLHHHLQVRIHIGNLRTIGTITVLVVKSYGCLTIIVGNTNNSNTIIMIRIDTEAMERSAIPIKNFIMPAAEDAVIVICHRRLRAVPVIIVHNRGTDQRIRSDLYDLLVVYCCVCISLCGFYLFSHVRPILG